MVATNTEKNIQPVPVTATAEMLPEVHLGSPIDGMTPEDLSQAVVTPFLPPEPASDNPHHGVDLADRAPGTDIALEGRPVQVVLAGRVAGIVADRFPYGNAVIIETPLQDLPVEWISRLELPEIHPVDLAHSALTCPVKLDFPPAGVNPMPRSLYLLYAHLKDPLQLQPGDPVTCGQVIGVIGKSGNAINPHLHLEARVGFGNIILGSMAHYDESASQEEMAWYCLWRISGYFQMIDPMKLFKYEMR